MRRSTWDGDAVVYRYGCPSWGDLDSEGMRQLRLAHDLRNELVAVERRYEAMNAALWLSIPEVAAAAAALDRATEAFDTLGEEAKRGRVRDRSTVADPALRQRYTDARAARKAAKADLKEAKDLNRERHRALRAGLDAAKRYAVGKDNLYRDFVQTRGLGWATYTDVLDKHRTSVSRVMEARKRGEPAEHRFRAWTGEGTLTVQVQRTKSGGLRRQWSLEDGRPAKEWLDRDRRIHETVTTHRRTLRLQIGRTRSLGPHWLELPVVAHRPVPPGAEVTYVRVTRRTVAGRPQLSVTLTARTGRPAVKVHGEAVDVDLRWTSGGPAAGVRVARISTASGSLPPPPPDVASMVTAADWYEVWAPAAWRDLLGRDDAIRADRSELLDDLRPAVADALADPHLAELTGFTAAQARLMKFAKYDRLARTWPADHPLHGRLQTWRARDRHLWQYEANERQQVVARRRDAYRKVAAWICDAARAVAIRDVDVSDLRRRPDVATEDTYEARAARRQIQFAAPAEFRSALVNAAARRGVQVLTYSQETP